MSKVKKIYTSKSEISIKVLLGNGKTLRVAFTPRTMGSSVFMTDDEEIQKAIELHKEYGKLFVCKNATIAATASQRTEQPTDNGQQPTDSNQECSPEGKPEPKIINVGSVQEAKDYLADKFGISRTSLKNREAVKSAGVEMGVVFEGI
ncbi:MAG: hypothetical protein IKB96_02020 [Prevotella sp.]|nr:hypothetical protein [Prevotella sp.]MBR4040811.1 hypothetical protein [Bacteroidaceae bacterium]